MKKRILTIALILVGFTVSFGQNSLNDYKYVIVPNYFEFLKGKDMYRLNTMTRFLLKKYGLNAYMEEEITAQDYKRNNCLGLRANVLNIKGMFTTKVKVVLTNCNNEVVFETKEGKSKIKTYEEGYKDALQKAFVSFEDIDYQYNPNNALANNQNSEVSINENSDEEVQQLKAQIEQLKKEKELEAKKIAAANKKAEEERKKQMQEEKEMIKKVNNEKFNVKEEFGQTKAEKRLKNNNSSKPSNLLYAQELENGYQLVDNTPKVVMVLIETPQKNFYIVKDQNAIVFKENGAWYFSKGDEKKQLNIKF